MSGAGSWLAYLDGLLGGSEGLLLCQGAQWSLQVSTGRPQEEVLRIPHRAWGGKCAMRYWSQYHKEGSERGEGRTEPPGSSPPTLQLPLSLPVSSGAHPAQDDSRCSANT